METAILAVILVLALYSAGLATIAYRRVAKHLFDWGNLGTHTIHNLSVIHGKVEGLESSVEGIQDVLKEASRLKAAKDSPFEPHDKMPATGKLAYVPIARRRALAERESLGPATHAAKVREANAKAMERVG